MFCCVGDREEPWRLVVRADWRDGGLGPLLLHWQAQEAQPQPSDQHPDPAQSPTPSSASQKTRLRGRSPSCQLCLQSLRATKQTCVWGTWIWCASNWMWRWIGHGFTEGWAPPGCEDQQRGQWQIPQLPSFLQGLSSCLQGIPCDHSSKSFL